MTSPHPPFIIWTDQQKSHQGAAHDNCQSHLHHPGYLPLDRLGQPDKLLFFDIETTGFSGANHQVYLIGCVCRRNKTWHLTQWFADTPDAEKDVLTAFFQYAGGFAVLVHFNGDTFDIPFLRKRFQAWGLPYDLSSFDSVDIYKHLRPLRGLIGLDSLKQKSIEQFLGISRQDPYSGGQLIDVYRFYLETSKEDLYKMPDGSTTRRIWKVCP